MAHPRRVVIALGGNAMTGPDGSATPAAQRTAIAEAARHVAEVVRTGAEVVLTHGNGPQVGNLLVKNELAAHEVPPVPLDWNVAQTQATIGFTLADELDAALAERGLPQRTAALVTRTSSTRPTRPSRTRPSPSAATCPGTGHSSSSTTARPGRTAARVAGAGSSPPPSRAPSSTVRPSRR